LTTSNLVYSNQPQAQTLFSPPQYQPTT
jgi:hypothetical protein